MENFMDIDSCVLHLHKCGEIFCDTLAASNVNLSFQCSFCRKTFTELNIFLNHLQSIHNKPSQPTVEFSSDNNKPADKGEIENTVAEDGDNGNECALKDALSLLECSLKGNKKKVNNEHKRKELSSKNESDMQSKPFAKKRKPREHDCPHCCKVFKRMWDLKQHLHIHDGLKPYECDHCPASFACKSNLIVHIRVHKGDRPFMCHFCTRSFVSTSERYVHERYHTGERPYVCEFCGKSFATSSSLKSHCSSQHLNERNYVCDKCNKRFNRPSQLRMHHTNIHTEAPRTHVCTICKAAFKGKAVLKVHMNTHTEGPRTHICTICKAAFKTKTGLKIHFKIHKEKTHECLECGKKFAQSCGLYTHRKTHQKQKEKPVSTDQLKQEIF